ncbi:MAG: type II toxin-antitoxin system PemK/MazF family toxin [Planctomycetes bacterium]|nr:type II toxin-antitoxin system PemK/MazF family toxin [Planctomycetota bacterium]
MTGAAVAHGDVLLVRLDPTVGSEERKTRPVVVVSNDSINRHARVFIAVPFTSSLRPPSPTQVIVHPSASNGLKADSRALCEHLRSLDKQRIVDRWGRLSTTDMRRIEGALRIALNQF